MSRYKTLEEYDAKIVAMNEAYHVARTKAHDEILELTKERDDLYVELEARRKLSAMSPGERSAVEVVLRSSGRN